MTVSRLRHIPGIGVNVMGDRADALGDPSLLRLENLDTDVPPPAVAVAATRAAAGDDAANSYLPFEGHRSLRVAAAAHVSRMAGVGYDPETQCVSVAGGLNGVLNVLLATVEPGREVVLADPIYAGLVNRIRLAGGVPRHVALLPTATGWRSDPEAIAAAIGPETAAVLLMGPSMPTGGLLHPADLDPIAEAVERHDAWVLYDAAMERLRFDGGAPGHPARHPGLTERTITVGSASKELRMIGWRVGWVCGPVPIMRDIALVGLTNVVCQVGIAQAAVAAALDDPGADEDVAAVAAEYARRAATITSALDPYPVIPADGGWSLLVDAVELGTTAADASARLFEHGRVAATAMDGWGPSGARYLRLVFSNEPVERLADLRSRFDAAFG